jgi:ABC-type nitrate/sulfonate/bicarbonate transport system ATPase subunit
MSAYTVKERVLTVDKLNLKFGNKQILRDISINIDDIVRPGMEQGQVVSLLGPSGIGKTQLFRCLAGLQPLTSGAVLLNEKKTPVTAGEVGVVFQNYPLMKSRTIWSNLKLATSSSGKKDEEIMEFLKRFDLVDKKDLYPAQLSGGQRQRIAIIQQMLCSTHFFLMDEPFSGLDVKMKNEVARLITEVSIAHELNTMIITTHDIETALRISDTIWILGFEKDATGARIPGSTVIKKYDLAAMGLAWDANVDQNPLFMQTLREMRDLFNSF